MNGTIVKKFAPYVIGAILGGGLGYILADHFATKAERLMKKYHEMDENVPGEEIPEEKKAPVEEWIPEDFTKISPKTKTKGKSKRKPTDYTKFAVGDNKKSIEEEVKARIGDTEAAGIYPINLAQWADTVPAHEKVGLTYYEEDDTLMYDVNEIIVDNPDKLVGDFAEKFGTFKDEDPDMVYIRNLKTKTDYEIVRVKNSYQQAILGVKPEEKEKENGRGVPKKPARRRTRRIDSETEGDTSGV